MKFIYSVIGDNTQENREWLEKVGYELNYIYNDEGVVYTRCDINSYYVGLLGNIKVENVVNCIGNPQLFQAVSAIREGSDYMQWFITTKGKWVLSKYYKKKQWSKYSTGWKQTCRKATLTELQERFKEKER